MTMDIIMGIGIKMIFHERTNWCQAIMKDKIKKEMQKSTKCKIIELVGRLILVK